jgi:hypothetical protein
MALVLGIVSLKISDKATRLGQRAYLSMTLDRVTSMYITKFNGFPESYTVWCDGSVTIKNAGNTPAYKPEFDLPVIRPNDPVLPYRFRKISVDKDTTFIPAKGTIDARLTFVELWRVSVFRSFFLDDPNFFETFTGKVVYQDVFSVTETEPVSLVLRLGIIDLPIYESVIPDIMKMFPKEKTFLRPRADHTGPSKQSSMPASH